MPNELSNSVGRSGTGHELDTKDVGRDSGASVHGILHKAAYEDIRKGNSAQTQNGDGVNSPQQTRGDSTTSPQQSNGDGQTAPMHIDIPPLPGLEARGSSGATPKDSTPAVKPPAGSDVNSGASS